MVDIALRVEGLSKMYRIGAAAPPAQGAVARLARAAGSPFAYLRRARRAPLEAETLWALHDVSFEVGRGEVVGIIGRNGAGKSTLLKILSRITEPTRGRAVVFGRVGSLLEVGTGFHPELTGRENVFLNGAILGMRRAEIDRKFDEIVAFSGVEHFLDTPVKRYSSGMAVRLAFAVAAHLETEVLLVDEVLAVGDAEFQRKCLGKMGDVVREGRTVLLVSHNLGSIAQLCRRAVLLRAGGLALEGPVDAVIREYLDHQSSASAVVAIAPDLRPDAPVAVARCWVENDRGQATGVVAATEPAVIAFEAVVRRPLADVEMSIRVHASAGMPLFTSDLSAGADFDGRVPPGRYQLRVALPREFLAPDVYTVTIGVHRPNVEWLDLHEHVLTFTVEETGSQMWRHPRVVRRLGNILVRFPWDLQRQGE